MTMGIRNVPENAWRRIQFGPADECWPWLGTIDNDGYGRMFVKGKNLLAHRLIYKLATGKDPVGMFVCHTCDNPRCCNFRHLFLGTPADNLRDAAEKGRMPRGEESPRAKLATADVIDIRRRYSDGQPRREIAALYSVTPENVSAIAKRKTWRYVA